MLRACVYLYVTSLCAHRKRILIAYTQSPRSSRAIFDRTYAQINRAIKHHVHNNATCHPDHREECCVWCALQYYIKNHHHTPTSPPTPSHIAHPTRHLLYSWWLLLDVHVCILSGVHYARAFLNWKHCVCMFTRYMLWSNRARCVHLQTRTCAHKLLIHILRNRSTDDAAQAAHPPWYAVSMRKSYAECRKSVLQMLSAFISACSRVRTPANIARSAQRMWRAQRVTSTSCTDSLKYSAVRSSTRAYTAVRYRRQC